MPSSFLSKLYLFPVLRLLISEAHIRSGSHIYNGSHTILWVSLPFRLHDPCYSQGCGCFSLLSWLAPTLCVLNVSMARISPLGFYVKDGSHSLFWVSGKPWLTYWMREAHNQRLHIFTKRLLINLAYPKKLFIIVLNSLSVISFSSYHAFPSSQKVFSKRST